MKYKDYQKQEQTYNVKAYNKYASCKMHVDFQIYIQKDGYKIYKLLLYSSNLRIVDSCSY